MGVNQVEQPVNIQPEITSVNCSCGEMVRRVQLSLMERGMRVLATFNLHDAVSNLDDCPCPYHGTSGCDCQMVVLLIYGEALAPTALTLHGNDGQTWLTLADDSSKAADPQIQGCIEEVVEGIRAGQGL